MDFVVILIDIHHHCLPGVDDGPREWDEALDMCRMSVDEGIETIIATPHVLRGRWRTAPPAELALRLDMLRSRTGDTPQILLGSEYFFAHDAAEVLKSGDAIVPLAGSRYILIELASNNVPPLIEQPLYRMQLDGWVPVIAHPERNSVLQAKPEIGAMLIHLGARMQITAGSLTGEFGAQARRTAEEWLENGMVHFVATDAHNTTKRPPRITAAAERLRQLVGAEACDALMHGNPRAVIENVSLPWIPETRRPKNHGFLARLRAFLAPRA